MKTHTIENQARLSSCSNLSEVVMPSTVQVTRISAPRHVSPKAQGKTCLPISLLLSILLPPACPKKICRVAGVKIGIGGDGYGVGTYLVDCQAVSHVALEMKQKQKKWSHLCYVFIIPLFSLAGLFNFMGLHRNICRVMEAKMGQR